MSSARQNSSSRDHRAKRDALRFVVDDQVIRLDPSTGTSAFEVVDEPARAYQNTPTAGRITGFGDDYDTCGVPMEHFCSDCGMPARDADGDPVEVGQTCWRQQCPRCGAGWAMRRAYPIVSKIESLRSEVKSERGDSPRFHHVVVPLDDFRAAGDADDAYFEVAKAAIEEVGVNVFGGALIHHPYSGSQEEDDDLNMWKRRLFSGLDWDEVREELEVDHHIHAMVLADTIDYRSCQALQDRTGVFVHRVENNDKETSVSLFDVEDLSEATTYALSHARESDNADAYRYFGRVANHSADHRIEARCKEVVRSVVPKTLDLTPSNLVCDRELPTELYDHAPNLSGYNYDSDDGDEDSDDGDDTDEEQQEIEDVESDDQDGCEEGEEGSEKSDDQTTEPNEGDEQADEQPDVTDDTDGEDSGESSDDPDADSEADSSDSGTDTDVHCNGRLVPMEYAPSWLEDDDRELEHADELQEAYENWDPPDQRDLDSFGSDETG